MKNKIFSWITLIYFFVKSKVKFNLKLSLILTVLLFNISAYAFGQKISFNVKNKKVSDVLKDITKKTGVNFFYNHTVFDDTQLVSISAQNLEVLDLINRLIGPNYRAVIVDQNVIAIEAVPVSKKVLQQTQELKIEGIVKDAQGVPLPGVVVLVKNEELGVLTDENGHYALTVKQGAVILFQYLGYKKTEITIKDNTTRFDITMQESQMELEDVKVVNTGYQKISKVRSAGSFGKPDMKVVENRTFSMNILQRLDGLVAGFSVNNNPAAASNPFLVRGLTTIGTINSSNLATGSGTNRNPLYVVDGIALDNISSINPQDVQDVNVLKDATASAIWGAKAANGVIVITTKKGKKGSKIAIDYDTFVNFQGRPDLGYNKYLNSSQFIQAAKETFFPDQYSWDQANAYAFAKGGVAPHLKVLYDQSRGLISDTDANAQLDAMANTSNRDQIKNLMYRNAILSNHSFSLSGGGEKYSFYTSATYTDNQDSTPGNEDKLYKINARQDFQINKSIGVYAITDFSKSKISSKRNLAVDYGFYPYQLFRDENGNNLSMPYMTNLSDEVRKDFENRSKISLDYNPLDEFNRGSTATDGFLSRMIGGLKVNIADGLKFEGTYGYIQGKNTTTSFDVQDSYKVRKELAQFTVADTVDDDPVYYLPSKGGHFQEINASQNNYTVRNQLEYNKGWNDEKHYISFLAGQEAQEQHNQSTSNLIRGFDPELLTYQYIDYATLKEFGLSNPVMPNGGSVSFLQSDGGAADFVRTDVVSRFTSYYLNGAYTYNKKYTLNGSWRRDQSNLFGIDKSTQNKPVWSAGAKWTLSNESFLYDSTVIRNLALRATYGLTGNSPSPGTASSYDILQPQTGYDNIGNVIPLTISTPGNKKLTWESTKNMNIGVDFTLFGDRIDGSIDVYKKNTENMIGQLPLNILTGYISAIGNFGSMVNKGIEFTLKSLNVETNNFSWTTQFTMAFNKNKITDLELPSEIGTGDEKVTLSYLKGYSAYAVFAYDYQGLDEEGDPLIKLADGTITKTPNITKPEDIVYKGSAMPVWTGGLTNIFNYKDITLSATAVYNLGHVMRKDVNTFYSGPLTHGADNFTGTIPHSDFSSRWRNPGDEQFTDIPKYIPNSSVDGEDRNVSYYTYGANNVLDASYIKFRDISLAYSLPKNVINKYRISALSFRLSVSNVMLWTANKEGIDPEFQIGFSRGLKVNQESIALGLHLSL